jgi:hypothetical protein
MTVGIYEEEGNEDNRPLTVAEQEELDALEEELAAGGITVVWLSSGEEDPEGYSTSFEEMAAEFAVQTHERQAAFEKGDIVVSLNPYTGDIQMYEREDEDVPRYFEVMDVRWDGGDDTYRYLLGGTDWWCAEGWLDAPDVPPMVKHWVEFSTPSKVDMTAQIDKLTTEFVSNSYLDMMNSEDPETRTKGLEGLKAMAAEGVI